MGSENLFIYLHKTYIYIYTYLYILEEVVMAELLSEGTEETRVKSPSTIPTHSWLGLLYRPLLKD
jgi:hypothetical protein